MKLYYAPRTRSGRVRWLLEELDAPYELVRLDFSKREHKQPSYLAVHPLGVVPALVDGDTTLIESAAICLYLADKFADRGLAPAPGTPERGLYYQWIVFSVVTIERLVVDALAALPREQPARAEALPAARAKLADALGVVERALDGKTWILGDRFSAADVMLGSLLVWARVSGLVEGHPAVEAYAKRLGDRPASKRARAD
jgi:glutathione S-transferase